MTNLVLNADFRLSDASERQILRQMANQQARFEPTTNFIGFIVDQARNVANLVTETRALMEEVDVRYPNTRRQYV